MSAAAEGREPVLAREARDRPLVTIIIPTYNRAGLVEQAINSTLDQDYPNLEVLVLDDGSTDATPAILAGYEQRHGDRFRWARHDNVGQARTLNRGFEMARGELVGYLSSDDLFLTGAISRLAAVLEEDREAVLVYPAFHMVDEHGAVLNTQVPPEYTAAESLRLHSCIVNVGAIFRRSVTERLGGWDPSFIYLADFDFCLRAATLGPFRRVEEPLACWRAHPGSANSAPGLLGASEQTRLLDKVYSRDDVPDELLAVRDEAYRNAYFVAAYAMGAVNTAGERFFVHDSLAQTVSTGAPSQDVELIARLRKRVAGLEQRERRLSQALESATRALEESGGDPAAASRFLRQPRWWRVLRGLVPQRLRPAARRLAERTARGRVPAPRDLLRAASRPGEDGSARGRAPAGSATRRD